MMYHEHIKTLCDYTEKSLKQSALHGEIFDGIIFHSGSDMVYHADDHNIAFHTVPHFTRWIPLKDANHFIRFIPGEKPKLIQYCPTDYWYNNTPLPHLPIEDCFEIVVVGSLEEIKEELGFVANCAYIGNNPDLLLDLGIFEPGVEPPYLMAALDWYRGYKTPYEVDCIKKAAQLAAKGYDQIAASFTNASERNLHFSYLLATDHLEAEMPYQPIIGWDKNSAILHYQQKDLNPPNLGHTLLIDAGANFNGYAIDITRTYLNEAHPTFAQLHQKVDEICQTLSAKCIQGSSFPALHVAAHQAIAEALTATGVLNCSATDAFEKGYTRAFFPHGLGHHLGIQVHDVSGFQLDIKGTQQEPDVLYPSLRTTRPIEIGNVLTIEPGIYFIPMLLTEHKDNTDFNWTLIDELIPLGGIRIEDNIVVNESGNENLTRALVPQPLYV